MSKINRFLLNFKYAFRWKKPVLILRLMGTMFKVIILRRRPLRYVDMAIDYKCNLTCEHCFATAFQVDGKQKMTFEDYSKVAKQARKLGAVSFSFQGGEPLMFKELPEIIQQFKPYKSLISVTTNGTLINEERIRQLKKAGVDILTISLDSAIPEEHDAFRGKTGTYEKTLAGIKLALKKGLRVTIGTTICHQNVHSKGLKDLFELARQLKVILVFALAAPSGNWSENNEILLTEEDMKQLKEYCKENMYLRSDFEANYLHYGCGAVKEIFYLTPYGDVLPCPFIHVALGNIYESSLPEIRKKWLKNKYFINYWNKCLCATDREFIEKHMPKGNLQGKLPVKPETVSLEVEK